MKSQLFVFAIVAFVNLNVVASVYAEQVYECVWRIDFKKGPGSKPKDLAFASRIYQIPFSTILNGEFYEEKCVNPTDAFSDINKPKNGREIGPIICLDVFDDIISADPNSPNGDKAIGFFLHHRFNRLSNTPQAIVETILPIGTSPPSPLRLDYIALFSGGKKRNRPQRKKMRPQLGSSSIYCELKQENGQ